MSYRPFWLLYEADPKPPTKEATERFGFPVENLTRLATEAVFCGCDACESGRMEG